MSDDPRAASLNFPFARKGTVFLEQLYGFGFVWAALVSDRLARLLENELIEQFPSPEHPGRDAYRLTKKGKSLRPVLKSILDWGLANIDGTRAELLEQSKRK